MKVRTRMAPSPTGEFHIGGMRGTLYNYALAKKNGGQFIMRIEDTDQERLVIGAVDRALDVIGDYGLSWDEGPRAGGKFGPYVQSERLAIYKDYALKLVADGKAYYCFCTEERLKALREEQQKAGKPVTKYDGFCRNLTKEEVEKNISEGKKYVIRLKVPENKEVSYTDAILGVVTFDSGNIDDQVLLKSDGFPTYHLGVVVDDHLMEITHILRGHEWLPSTPKHLLIYEAFGWEPPIHGHIPLLKELGSTKKLSKRTGSTSAISFLEEGYLPEALLNFLMFLGWNPGTEKELYTLDEFVADFSLEKLHKSDLIVFDREKLLWMNGMYIRKLSLDELYAKIQTWAKKFDIKLAFAGLDSVFTKKCLSLVQDRLRKLDEVNDLTDYFFETHTLSTSLFQKYVSDDSKVKSILTDFVSLYKDTPDWSKENLDKISHAHASEKGLKPKEAFMTLRIALTGREATPPLFDVMEVLGQKVVLDRLKMYI